ncbi:MAG: A/G-specific adenine glycosylase [Roseburia sp.]|nr:A/G-specific adenine glycosylase [Roseburia sp.]
MKIEEYNLRQLVSPLLDWFHAHARTLPWRELPTPYRVWVSEIMLQQTRVEAVKPYFERFVSTLPDIKSLAECQEEKLLKLWEGLGYYNRVRNMQTAAKQVMESRNGSLPEEYEELLKLKGIGHYTAGAISSIAYGKKAAAVDGNVLRVISRAAADERDITKQSVRSNMETELLKIIPEGQPGAFNQALMELGATVCLPKGEPKCVECPWEQVCLAKNEDKISQIPVKSKGRERRIEERTVLLIRDGEKILLHRRPAKGLLAGMYEFPNLDGYLNEQMALEHVKGLGLSPLRIVELEPSKHIFSHVEWHMKGYMVRVEALGEEESGLLFAEAVDFKENYAMPSAFRTYVQYLDILQGKDAM